jgi:hypothetical protein
MTETTFLVMVQYFTKPQNDRYFWVNTITFFSLSSIGGHIPKEARQIVSGLTKIFEDLDTVADYSQRHLPAFVMQAVHMVFWISMIVGTLDNEHRNVKHFKGQRPYSLLLFLVSQLLHLFF